MSVTTHCNHSHCWFALSLAGALLLTTGIYWPGLHGPFLLDDGANLAPVFGWLKGWYSASYVIFGNHSGLLHRPISMASFWLDAVLFHSSASFPYKLTNLGIHLACSLALLWLAWQVFRRLAVPDAGDADTVDSPSARSTLPRRTVLWLALVVAVWWLWLPLNVDTVLYTVQRMAQLAALFMLLALAIFMVARQHIAAGRASGWWLLWIGVPALTVLAMFSKENGVLVMPLALVLELFLFGHSEHPRGIKWFFGLTVALPIALGIAYLVYRPGFILGSYADRPFTLGERLLTEPRVMWSYVQTLLVPIGSHMGFFQDNFPLSTSLLHPWTTLPAILAWLATIVFGWRWRRVNPLFGLGVWCYLVGQALESGPIGLEIYFEHRNYLPSFGVLLAVVGSLIWAWRKLPRPTVMFRRLALGIAALVLTLFGLVTWGHVQSWRSARTFYAAQGVFNPTSPRYQASLVMRAFHHANVRGALRHIAAYERYTPARQHVNATLWRFLAYCSANITPPQRLYPELAKRAHGTISQHAMTAMNLLAGEVRAGCPGVQGLQLLPIMNNWFESSGLSSHNSRIWRTRYDLGQIVAQGGDLVAARTIVHRAWVESGYNNVLAVLLFQLNGSLGDKAACRKILARLEPAYRSGNNRLDQAIQTFRKALDDGKIQPQKGIGSNRKTTDEVRRMAPPRH